MDYSLCYWLSSKGDECLNPAINGFCNSCRSIKNHLYLEYKKEESYLYSLLETPHIIEKVIPTLEKVIELRSEFTCFLHPQWRDEGHKYHLSRLIHLLWIYKEKTHDDKLSSYISIIRTNPLVSQDISRTQNIVENYLFRNNLYMNTYKLSVLNISTEHLRILWNSYYSDLFHGTHREFANINNISANNYQKWRSGRSNKKYLLVESVVRKYLLNLILCETHINPSTKEEIVDNLPAHIKSVLIVRSKGHKRDQLANYQAPSNQAIILITDNNSHIDIPISPYIYSVQIEDSSSLKSENYCLIDLVMYFVRNLHSDISIHTFGCAWLVNWICNNKPIHGRTITNLTSL